MKFINIFIKMIPICDICNIKLIKMENSKKQKCYIKDVKIVLKFGVKNEQNLLNF